MKFIKKKTKQKKKNSPTATRVRSSISKYGLNGISLHSVDFELFKKVLLVALGIWISICMFTCVDQCTRH